VVDVGVLREIRDEEVDLMRSWRNAPTVRMNMYTRHEISPEEHRSWWAATRQRNDMAYFMYEHDGRPTGIVSFNSIDRVNRNSAWAFYADPGAAKGVGSKMELLALDYAFGPLGLHKLHCEVFAFNSAVVRLHQKFGFQVEGRFREHRLVDCAFVDVVRLGILAREWTSLRPQMLERIGARARG
jgi:UDP-4-amino-4,6-dideoxy-N-acetyl-beta-L-altrosamine N-acetyltransferase